INNMICNLPECEYVNGCEVETIDMGRGAGFISVTLKAELFYRVLGETTGLTLKDESDLMPCMIELAQIKKKYEKVKSALEEVQATGYGIVMPSIDELSLDEPEIVKQGGKYGVRLKAAAPSIHNDAINRQLSCKVKCTLQLFNLHLAIYYNIWYNQTIGGDVE
ncbi:MAG: stage IV sporulation protein A, partial [Oscillospiraceae bacterium]|nr:stage IV sporulation protein A [Oscillospiraceae bacterium]